MNYLKVGTIIRTKGLKGEVRVFSTTNFPEKRYKKGAKLFLKREDSDAMQEVTVHSRSFDGKFDLITFEGYDTIEAISPFLKADLFIVKEEHPLPEGYFYYTDLENCIVYDKNQKIGKVQSIEDYNGKISLRIERNGKTFLLPFYDAFIEKVDISEKRIDVHLIEGMLE